MISAYFAQHRRGATPKLNWTSCLESSSESYQIFGKPAITSPLPGKEGGVQVKRSHEVVTSQFHIARIGRRPATISKIERDLRTALKS
jgi:hypothetical protein